MIWHENTVHPGRGGSLNDNSQLPIFSVTMGLEEERMKLWLSIPRNFKISDANGLISLGSGDSNDFAGILEFGNWPSTIGNLSCL